MSRFEDYFAGRACGRCGAKRGLLTITYCHWMPPRPAWTINGHELRAATPGRWCYSHRGNCIDQEACRARARKREERARLRSSVLVLAEPKAPGAPKGTCCWCGRKLTGERAAIRNYCYPEREGRDCRGDADRARCFGARDLVQKRGDPVCVECGSDDRDWEADHEVALEDGGEHAPENIVRRCVPCHRDKTGRENAARARERRPKDAAQLTLEAA